MTRLVSLRKPYELYLLVTLSLLNSALLWLTAWRIAEATAR